MEVYAVRRDCNHGPYLDAWCRTGAASEDAMPVFGIWRAPRLNYLAAAGV